MNVFPAVGSGSHLIITPVSSGNSDSPHRDCEVATQWQIGSDPLCDLWIDQPTVSASHCRVLRRDGRFVVEDLGSTNGTTVNGQRISAATEIMLGDRVVLAGHIPMPWPVPPSANDVFHVGFAEDNDQRIFDDAVSGHHLQLFIDPAGQCIVTDLNSTNGTWIGDVAIRSAVVAMDQPIRIGNSVITATQVLGAMTEPAAPSAQLPTEKSDTAEQSSSPALFPICLTCISMTCFLFVLAIRFAGSGSGPLPTGVSERSVNAVEERLVSLPSPFDNVQLDEQQTGVPNLSSLRQANETPESIVVEQATEPTPEVTPDLSPQKQIVPSIQPPREGPSFAKRPYEDMLCRLAIQPKNGVQFDVVPALLVNDSIAITSARIMSEKGLFAKTDRRMLVHLRSAKRFEIQSFYIPKPQGIENDICFVKLAKPVASVNVELSTTGLDESTPARVLHGGFSLEEARPWSGDFRWHDATVAPHPEDPDIRLVASDAFQTNFAYSWSPAVDSFGRLMGVLTWHDGKSFRLIPAREFKVPKVPKPSDSDCPDCDQPGKMPSQLSASLREIASQIGQ